MILVIDNYDSFTFNLVQALEAAGARLLVARNDRIRAGEIERLAGHPATGPRADESEQLAGDPGARSRVDGSERLRAILVSPGPGTHESAGISIEAIRIAARRRIPMLGVCLGLQSLGAAFGADVVRAPSLVHGESSEVVHDGAGVLAGIPSPFTAGRYHSLCLDPATLPPELEVTARTSDGVVMAVRHRALPLEGVQFHPESVLTTWGPRVLANFLRMAGEGDPGFLDEAMERSFATRGGTGRGDTGRRGTGRTSRAEVTAR
jgi:para-aminobenzoate synthetase component 2